MKIKAAWLVLAACLSFGAWAAGENTEEVENANKIRNEYTKFSSEKERSEFRQTLIEAMAKNVSSQLPISPNEDITWYRIAAEKNRLVYFYQLSEKLLESLQDSKRKENFAKEVTVSNKETMCSNTIMHALVDINTQIRIEFRDRKYRNFISPTTINSCS